MQILTFYCCTEPREPKERDRIRAEGVEGDCHRIARTILSINQPFKALRD